MRKHNFFRSSSQALLANMAQQGFALLQFMLVARLLAPSALGEWAMFLTLASLVEMARLGLVQNALVHFSTHQPEARPQLATAAFLLSLAAQIGGSVLLLSIAPMLRSVWQMPNLSQLLMIYACFSPIYASLRTLEGLRMAVSDFSTLLLSNLVFGGLYLIFCFSIPFLTPSVSTHFLLLLQLPAALIALAIVYILVKKQLVFGKIERKYLTQIFQFGRYGMGTNLCSMLFQRADLFLLGAFVAPSAVATYSVATRIISYMDFPLNAFGLALMPRLSAAHQAQNREGVARHYEQSVGNLLAITLPMVLAVLLGAPFLVQFIAGNNFAAAVPLVQILALASIVKPFGRVFGVTLDAIGQPIWNFRMLLISMVITLIINALLIPNFGILGAAIASSFSIVVTIWIGQNLLRRWLLVNLPTIFGTTIGFYFKILRGAKTSITTQKC